MRISQRHVLSLCRIHARCSGSIHRVIVSGPCHFLASSVSPQDARFRIHYPSRDLPNRFHFSTSPQPLPPPKSQSDWRDYSSLGARAILDAIGQLTAPTLASILRYLAGGLVPKLRRASPRPTTHYPPEYNRELLALLLQEAYVQETTRRIKKRNDIPIVSYSLTARGKQIVRLPPGAEIRLPVTAALRQRDEVDAQQRERYRQQLQEHLTSEQLQTLELDVLRIHAQWIELLTEAERKTFERLDALKCLPQIISNWREAEFSADGALISDALVLQVAHYVGTGLPGEVISFSKLRSLLIPSSVSMPHDVNAALERLREQLAQWVQQHQPPIPRSELDAPMVLGMVGKHLPWQYAHSFSFARHSPSWKWDETYALYKKKPRPAEELARELGAPTSVARLHLFDALLHGRFVHLEHIGTTPVPTRREWLKLQQAERRLHIQVTGDPETAGPLGRPLNLHDLLRPILGDFLLDMMPGERSEVDQAVLQSWFHRVRWYLALRRAGYKPKFAPRAEDDIQPTLLTALDQSDA